MKPKYIIETYDHGWLICSPPGQTGIELGAFAELCKLVPPDSVICPGIPAHFRRALGKKCVAAIGLPKEIELWRKEIESWLEVHVSDPYRRWWCGLETGKSSDAIFAAISDRGYGDASDATPLDSADLGRCLRLVNRFNWRDRLHEVAAKYPDTKWPAIIARWDELAAAAPKRQREILNEINR